MSNIKSTVTKAIVTIIIGGSIYNVSQSDIIKNFSANTGLTQEQAENYINEIPEEQLASWTEIGWETISIGQEIRDLENEMDCVNYEYEWESVTLSCPEAKKQVIQFASNNILLGQAYLKLDLESASESDIREVIRLINQTNNDLQLEIFSFIDSSIINEQKMTNSYNKAILQSVLESIGE